MNCLMVRILYKIIWIIKEWISKTNPYNKLKFQGFIQIFILLFYNQIDTVFLRTAHAWNNLEITCDVIAGFIFGFPLCVPWAYLLFIYIVLLLFTSLNTCSLGCLRMRSEIDRPNKFNHLHSSHCECLYTTLGSVPSQYYLLHACALFMSPLLNYVTVFKVNFFVD